MYNPALRSGYDIVKAPPLVHSQCQGAILYLISKGKLHFIAVS